MADVLLVVDRSGSIGTTNWRKVVDYKKARVDGVTFSGAAGNRIGVVAFATQSSVECPITSDKAQLLSCIDDIGYTGGWTYMADAIQLAGDHMDRMSSSQRTRVIERVLLFLTPLSFLCLCIGWGSLRRSKDVTHVVLHVP